MPYNEWDDPTTPIPSLDEMKYELAAKNPINLVKKAIEHMPGSAFVQGVAPIVNFIPQVAGSALYGLGKQIFSPSEANFTKDTTEAMRALRYEPPSQGGRDYQEAIAKALEVSKLPPYIGHMPPMRISPSDVQVIGARGISAAREIGDIPRDFQAAQSGLTRQNVYGQPTYGARLQGVAEDVGDVMARQQARRSEYSAPLSGSVQVFGDMFPDTAMYAVRPNKSGSQVIREVPTPLNPAYSITGEARLSEDLSDIIDRQGPRTEDEKSYQHLTQFTNFIPAEFNKSAQAMFTDFVQPKLAVEFPDTDPGDYSRAVHAKYGNKANDWYKKQLEEFALTPEARLHNEKAFQVAMSDPDVPNPFNFLRDVLIIPPSAEFAGKTAADSWVMNNLQNYLVEHLGTPSDPLTRLIAETGRTTLEDARNRLLTQNQRVEDQVRDLRTRAGMPTQGTYEPEINKLMDRLPESNVVINHFQDIENELVANNPGMRPQDIPGWKENHKELVQATKRKDEINKKLENLQMAQAYENYSDLELSVADEQRFTENLEPYFKERFPMIPTNKDVAYQMRVPKHLRELASDIRNRLIVSGAPGIKNVVKPEDVASYSVPKAVQIQAEMMAAREKMSEKVAKANEEKLMRHTKARMESMPQDGTYGPTTVGRITKDLSADQIKSDLSDITYWMDHCLGRGGSPDKKILSPKAKALGIDNVADKERYRGYIPTVESHLDNRVPVGSSGSTNQYMNEVRRGEIDVVDFRDTATGVPFATLKLIASKNEPGKYQLSEFFGYRDHEVTGPWAPTRTENYTTEENNAYRQSIADWANDHASQLKTSSSEYLPNYADIFDTESSMHKDMVMARLHIKKDELKELLYKIDKRFITLPETQAALEEIKANPPETIESLRAQRDDLQMVLTEAEDPEASMGIEQMDDIRHQITILDQMIAEMENRPPTGARAIANANETFQQIRNELNRQVTDEQAQQQEVNIQRRFNEILNNPNTTVEHLRTLLADLENQNHPQYQWLDADVYDTLHQRVYDAIQNRPQPAVTVRTGWNPFINQAREDMRNSLDEIDGFSLNAAIEETQNRFAFSEEPHEFVSELRRRANYYDGRNQPDLANAIRGMSNAYESQIMPAQAQLPVAPAGDAYTTVQRALQPLIEGEHLSALIPIAENMMGNRNGVYAQLNDNQRIALRQQLYDEIDRIRSNQEPTPLTDIVAMDMNRIRDEYGEAMERQIDGVLTNIQDNYDIDADPALFIERVRQYSDIADRNNEPQIRDIYNNLATVLTDTLRENNAIVDAQRRLRAPQEEEETFVLEDNHLDDIASDIMNRMTNPTAEFLRNEANDMRNGMYDLPELRELPENARQQARDELAYRFEQYADMMDEMDDTNAPPPAQEALPAPAPERTPEQNALNEALQHPRFWFNRYPDIPDNLVYNILSSARNIDDIVAMQENAANANPRTIFRNTTNIQRRQLDDMFNSIRNGYQNEIQRLDNPNQEQYNTVVNAYVGISDANNQFRGEEGLNALRALPQLIRRQNTRQALGVANLSVDERDALIRDFEELYASRTQLPPPEGHKRGGYIRRKNTGGRIEPSSPSSSVNDQSKPVPPVKKIQNPDAPEFKDMFIRERAIRGGTQPGGPSADIKQIMNPRNINYRKGGSVSIDEMRYELLRKQ